ncbi:hypothetical protein EDB80DRAFT_773897 [Ilyonectria destructans]|nr:hypothetical protein EDB80DRAFT_773897 [Ilyonectria destructans]
MHLHFRIDRQAGHGQGSRGRTRDRDGRDEGAGDVERGWKRREKKQAARKTKRCNEAYRRNETRRGGGEYAEKRRRRRRKEGEFRERMDECEEEEEVVVRRGEEWCGCKGSHPALLTQGYHYDHHLRPAARTVQRQPAAKSRRATIPVNRPSPELRLARLELVLELPDQGALGGGLGGVLGGVSAMAAHDDCRLAMDGALKAWIPGPLGRTQGEHDLRDTSTARRTTASQPRRHGTDRLRGKGPTGSIMACVGALQHAKVKRRQKGQPLSTDSPDAAASPPVYPLTRRRSGG